MRSNVPSLVRYDLGFLVCGAVAGGERAPRVNAGHVASSLSEEVRCRLTRSERFEIAIQKKPRISPWLSRVMLLPVSSVGTDSDANAGGADADAAATFLIAAPLDIALARGISV